MPEQTPQRQPFSGLNFIRRLIPGGGDTPEIQPDPEGINLPPPPPAQQAPPGDAPQQQPLRPQAADPAPAPNPAIQTGSTNLPTLGWRPIQHAPGYTLMAERVRELLAGYSPVLMETISIAMPYSRESFAEALHTANERMIEMALPQALAQVSTGAYMGTFARNDVQVRMFTDAERTETLLFTSSPIPMAYRWAGGPRADLNVPLTQVQGQEAAMPVVELPEVFTRPVPERPVYHYDPFYHEEYQVQNNQVHTPDVVTNEEAQAHRAAAWLPATLSPGYMIESVRAQYREIVGRFTSAPLETMQILVGNLHGRDAVLDIFNAGDVYGEGVRLNEDRTVGRIANTPVTVLLHSNPASDGGYVYLHGEAPLLLKVEGPLLPEIAALPRYEPGQILEGEEILPGEEPENDVDGPQPF